MKSLLTVSLLFLLSMVGLAQAENCNNGIDDDGDGFVDLFDDDCACNSNTYQAYCPVPCEYIPDSFPDFEMQYMWQSDVDPDLSIIYSNLLSGDVDGDGKIEIVALAVEVDGNENYYIMVLNGRDGSEKTRILIPNSKSYSIIHGIAMADVGNVNEVTFFVKFRQTSLMAFALDGTMLWQASEEVKGAFTPGIADFNGDGLAEVYVDDHIYNSSTGQLLVSGVSVAGFVPLFNTTTNTIAADVLPHKGQELVDGNVVYEVNIVNTNSVSGNSMNPIYAPPDILEGFCSVADIDGDGQLDVIVQRDATILLGELWVWNPRTQQLIAKAPSFRSTSIPFVGDVNNDCIADIGVVNERKLRMLTYDGSTTLSLLWSKEVLDGSGATGITMFDFNQDGRNELVYRDEGFLQVINGESGDVITQTKINNGTFVEYPIIADIDKDGEAEIIIHGYDIDFNTLGDIHVFESVGSPWAPCRNVWNQYSYNVTNVNDDLTIPKEPQNPAAFFTEAPNCFNPVCDQPYNSFLTQATYRTQEGCVQFPTIDLAFSIISTECVGSSVELCFKIENLSLDKDLINEEISVSIYRTDPLISNNLIYEEDLVLTIAANSEDVDQCIVHSNSFSNNKVYVAFNADNTQNPVQFPTDYIVECDYTNNLDSFFVSSNINQLDLGPDLILCSGERVQISAEEGYHTYLWGSGETTSELQVSESGNYSLTVTDLCGNTSMDEVLVSGEDLDILTVPNDSITFCPGTTISVGLNQGIGVYSNIIWSPSNLVNCITCEDVVVAPLEETMIFVSASLNDCIYEDSILLSPKPLLEHFTSENICQGDSILFGGQYYFANGLYTYVSLTCDTVFIMDLKVNTTLELFNSKSICHGDSIHYKGQWLKETDTYIFTESGPVCDTVFHLDLTVQDSMYRLITHSICKGDTVFFNSSKFFDEGEYREVMPNNNSCDSLIDLRIEIIESQYEYVEEQRCEGESIEVGGQIFTSNIVDSLYSISSLGCDSIIYIDLSFVPIYDHLDSVRLCSGDTVWLGDLPIVAGGVYSDKHISALGCDSINRLFVELDTVTTIYNESTICEGDSILLFGAFVEEEGIYRDTITGQYCDQILITQVLVNDQQDSFQFIDLCPGDSIDVNGILLKEEGVFSYQEMGDEGCLINYTVELSMSALPDAPLLEVDCELSTAEVFMEEHDAWMYQWSNGSLFNNASYNSEGLEFVNLLSIQGCEWQYEFEVPQLPELEQRISLKDTTINIGALLDLSVDLSFDQWSLEWTSDIAEFDCTDCPNVSINAYESGFVDLTYGHDSGCIYQSSFYINVEEVAEMNDEIYIPNVFSPNGDNSNDQWQIFTQNMDLLFDVQIYDRWGSRVAAWKQSNLIVWDGTYNGVPVMSGVYVYIMSYHDGIEQKTIPGTISLLR